MESATSEAPSTSLPMQDLAECLWNCSSKNWKDRRNHVCEYVKTITGYAELSPESVISLQNFFAKWRVRWNVCHRNVTHFQRKNRQWLSGRINISAKNPVPKAHGRPSTDFCGASERSKRRKTEDLRATFTSEELSYAAQMQLRSHNDLDAANIIKEIITSPERAKEYREADRKSKVLVKPYTSDEALSLIVEAKLSKNQYNLMRDGAKIHSSNLYPSYGSILEAKKNCYPSNIIVNETCAEVSLQSLLDHTVSRILKLLGERLFENVDNTNLNLIVKWGCDGTSGLSEYKQKFEESTASDSSIFVSSLVPLQLETIDTANEKKIVLWKNDQPSSARLCRPICLKYVHETTSVIVQEVNRVENEIKNLNKSDININDYNFKINYTMLFTMIDGKVCNAVAENSATQRCYLCGLTCKDFNNMDLMKQQTVEDGSKLRFGLSPLHAWIRFFECLLHLSYKMTIQQWHVRGEENKKIVAENKRRLQMEFKAEMGLLVDKPKPGFGTSNDGNTARRFFRNASMSAKITGVAEDIITRFHNILITISSTHPVKVDIFKVYCLETAEKFVKLYPWYSMPTTVHKILIHSSDIIKHALLPIGQLGEEAQESRNKDIKNYRERYSRKFCRTKTTEDVVHRLLVSSDPFISGTTTATKKKVTRYPKEVIQFLDITGTVDEEEEEEEDEEY